MIDAILRNPTLAGAFGLMLTGAALYVLRSIPVHAWWLIVRNVTVSLTVSGDDEVFDWVEEWLAAHGFAKNARTLKLTTGRASDGAWTLSPGYGKHVFWDGGLVVVQREVDEKVTTGYSSRPRERIKIRMVGRSQVRIRAMVAKANAHRQQRDAVGIRVWTQGWWLRMPSKAKRPIESVFLPAEQKREILDQTAWFFGNRDWFGARGIPYRHGYLLYGPPGTGKTSLVMAIASHFNRPIYVLNLATMKDDNELLTAFSQAGPNSVILIEDIDCARASAARPITTENVPVSPGEKAPEPMPVGISMSGLLNAIDGVAAPEGRLLFLTTNHIDKLDAALIRSARIDKRFEIGPLAPEQVREMAERFFPGEPHTAMRLHCDAINRPARPAADWQDEMMNIARGAKRVGAEREERAA